MIFEPVEVLVPFAADLTAIGLFLFHANCTRIGDRRFGVDN